MIDNPCFCRISLQTGTKIIAAFEMFIDGITSGYYFYLATTWLIRILNYHRFDPTRLSKIGIVCIFSVQGTFCVVSIILTVVLIIGANQRNFNKCYLWFAMKAIFLSLGIGLVMGFYALSPYQDEDTLINVMAIPSITLVFWGYGLWVVFAFCEEIQFLDPRKGADDVIIVAEGKHF